jgi:hypothetical protein
MFARGYVAGQPLSSLLASWELCRRESSNITADQATAPKAKITVEPPAINEHPGPEVKTERAITGGGIGPSRPGTTLTRMPDPHRPRAYA